MFFKQLNSQVVDLKIRLLTRFFRVLMFCALLGTDGNQAYGSVCRQMVQIFCAVERIQIIYIYVYILQEYDSKRAAKVTLSFDIVVTIRWSLGIYSSCFLQLNTFYTLIRMNELISACYSVGFRLLSCGQQPLSAHAVSEMTRIDNIYCRRNLSEGICPQLHF